MSIPYYHRTLVTFSRSKSIQSSNENMKNTFFAERIVGKDSSHHHHLSIVLNRWKVLLVRERQKERERESEKERERERTPSCKCLNVFFLCVLVFVCLYLCTFVHVFKCIFDLSSMCETLSMCSICTQVYACTEYSVTTVVLCMYTWHWVMLCLSIFYVHTYLMFVWWDWEREKECIAVLSL